MIVLGGCDKTVPAWCPLASFPGCFLWGRGKTAWARLLVHACQTWEFVHVCTLSAYTLVIFRNISVHDCYSCASVGVKLCFEKTLDMPFLAYGAMGDFGTIVPYLHGGLWNHCSIPPWGTLEPLFHTSMGDFGTIVPYLHGELWNHCSIPSQGTLEPLLHTSTGDFGAVPPRGIFGTIVPYLHSGFWNSCSIILCLHGDFGTIVPYLHGTLWNHCSIPPQRTLNLWLHKLWNSEPIQG